MNGARGVVVGVGMQARWSWPLGRGGASGTGAGQARAGQGRFQVREVLVGWVDGWMRGREH